MDWIQLLKFALKRWYLFVISVFVTCVIGGVYYLTMSPVYTVSASLMLRQSSDKKRTTQEELMNIMGFGGEKITGDEVEVLTSRNLMQKVVEQRHLNVTYFAHPSRYWICQYPEHDFDIILPDTLSRNVTFDIRVKTDGVWKMKVQSGRFTSKSYIVSDPSQAVRTYIGDIRFRWAVPVKPGRYRVRYETMAWTVRRYSELISVSRLARESNIIRLTAQTSAPDLVEDVINTLLTNYSDEATADKNVLAVQAARFLDDRLAILAEELTEAETEKERYKREHRISDLDHAADSYRAQSDQYQRRIAQMDAEAEVLQFINRQITLPENENSVLPANLGVSDATLQELIQTYNSLIQGRSKLLQTASPTNPTVVQISNQITLTRTNLVSAIEKAQHSLQLLRQSEVAQQRQYDAMLSALPEQEKHYLEMQRVCNTKEKQYLYLVQKRESNALLLASDAVPAKIIDKAQANPLPDAPNLKMTLLIALFLGLLLPFCGYLLFDFRRQYLASL